MPLVANLMRWITPVRWPSVLGRAAAGWHFSAAASAVRRAANIVVTGEIGGKIHRAFFAVAAFQLTLLSQIRQFPLPCEGRDLIFGGRINGQKLGTGLRR